jgi:DNA-binding NtrC family response regulator
MQVKLLRDPSRGHAFAAWVTSDERQSRCRVVSASHARLDQLVAEGRFREDLFYRLHVLNLEVPALRARRDDIPLLIEHLLTRIAAERGGEPVSLSRAALRALVDHRWPGNVRELDNELSRAALLCEGRIELEDLSPAIVAGYRGQVGAPQVNVGVVGSEGLKGALAAYERSLIEATLAECEGNVTRAAEALSVHRVALHRKIRALGIAREEERR